ncbi:hypothetical protein [Ulvibacterium marinum]|nr:hypothetical protein [Ulvibacterium marinum]
MKLYSRKEIPSSAVLTIGGQGCTAAETPLRYRFHHLRHYCNLW